MRLPRSSHPFATLAAALVGAVFAASSLTACDPTYDFSKVDQQMAAKLTSVPVEGASLVVFHEGKQIFKKAYGSYTSTTVKPIASGSKWLSAAAIMTLVDAGKLSLDAPINSYLPQATGAKGTVTLRQLLSFTSGLATDPACAGASGWTLTTCTDWILGRPMTAAPGAEYRYGSGHLVVAGRIAEIASAKPFATLFTDAIAKPVGMAATSFPATNPNPAGSARSSLDDYAKFVQMIAAEGVVSTSRVLSVTAVREMLKDQTGGAPIVVASAIRKSLGSRYGFGEWRDQLGPGTTDFEVSSPGAFGMHPWIDHSRNLVAVYFVYYRGTTNEFLAGGWDIKTAVRNAIDAHEAGG
jgi:CubicO group peptidase (beta-lactamase class C family)